MGAVARNAHDQIFVVIRVFLRLQQRLPIDDVELHVHAFFVEVAANQSRKTLKSIISGKG